MDDLPEIVVNHMWFTNDDDELDTDRSSSDRKPASCHNDASKG